MNTELFPIVQGDTTLYAKPNHNGMVYSVVGFTVKRDLEHYYCVSPSSATNDAIPEGMVAIGIADYLLAFYKGVADQQLNDEIERQVTTCDMQHLLNEELYKRFWTNAITLAGKEVPKDEDVHASLVSIVKGVVTCTIDRVTCIYDFNKGEHIAFRDEYRGKLLDVTPVKIFYGKTLLYRIAEEQNKRGLAPMAYMELTRLNQFLQEKKSVKLVMKDGKVYDIRPYLGSELQARNILSANYNDDRMVYVLRDSYVMKSRLTEDVDLDELDYLQFRNIKHYINAKALVMPKREMV